MDKVTFTSEGVKCTAFLGVPTGAAGSQHPAIVLGHGFGIRKESLVVEAEHLTAAGFVTLAIDYRTFGESGGEPRGSLFPLNEVEDFRNAITYLQRRDDVDPFPGWGAYLAAHPQVYPGGIVAFTALALGDAVTWKAIAYDGSLGSAGMRGYKAVFSAQEIEAIRAYVISRAEVEARFEK